jgi:hypothetical protein
MATNSSQAGYLAPSSAAVYDDALDDFLQQVIVGLTGLPGSLVRPRWQAEPLQRPDFTVNWVSFGLARSEVDPFAYEAHDPAGEGPTIVERDEILTYAHSFYGPNAHGLVERLRDGFEIPQNRDVLASGGLGLIEVQEAVKVPSLLAERWVPKIDVSILYRRRTRRAYPVLTIKTAGIELVTEHGSTPISVTQP